jgi:hypothetical protein
MVWYYVLRDLCQPCIQSDLPTSPPFSVMYSLTSDDEVYSLACVFLHHLVMV